MSSGDRGTQTRSWRSRLRVLEAALSLFAERGYEATSFKDIATSADVSVGLACRYFPTKEHLALAVYARLADALSGAAADIAPGTIAERFAAAMDLKLRSLEPHRRALTALAGKAIDPQARAGVLGDSAAPVRARVLGVFELVVTGASDAPESPEAAARLARTLYGVHLAFVLLWLQTDASRLSSLRALAGDAAKWIALLGAMAPAELTTRFEALLGDRLVPSRDPDRRAREILKLVFARRRVLPGVPPEPTEAALALHLALARAQVESGQPIRLVLPAFPAKSSSPAKVLGARPDLAEELALRRLSTLLDAIGALHAPGAELVVCSDGHVFADLVGVRDADVDRYRADLAEMLSSLGETRVRLFDLRDAFGDVSPSKARTLLLDRYAQPLETIRARAASEGRHRAQVDGIHRFLVEDEIARRPSESKSHIRKETRESAYEVVRRSDAWGGLVAASFPGALRLSIHPQPDVSEKIGVQLLETDDAWLTPWHACAVLRGDGYTLMHRAEAEKLGARVVEEEGRAWSMEIAP